MSMNTPRTSVAGIDLVDVDQYERGVPYDQLDRLRREAPVYYHDDPYTGVPFWAVTLHEDVQRVSRDWRTFSSYARGAVYREPENDFELEQERLIMLNMDPPEHSRLRSIVNKGFTPRVIEAMRDTVRAYAHRIMDQALDEGEGDFVRLVSAELPLEVIADLIGVEPEVRDDIFDISNRLIGFDDPEFQSDDQMVAAMEMFAQASQVRQDRIELRRDDVATILLDAEVEGKRLDEAEYNFFFLLLAVAGNETTRNAISQGMLAFFQHPDQWRLLLDDRSLLVPAADEVLRWSHPVIQFRRTATQDVELRSQRIEAGDKVLIYYASANRDERVFEDPYVFDIARSPNPHISFGAGGPHYCLGASLAKLEIEVMFDVLAERAPNITQVGEAARLRSNFINGIKTLPVRFA